MNKVLRICLLSFLLGACEQKPPADVAPEEPETAAQHVSTEREAFKAAGAAKEQIEARGAERNSAADDAMKAGE